MRSLLQHGTVACEDNAGLWGSAGLPEHVSCRLASSAVPLVLSKLSARPRNQEGLVVS